MLKTLIIDDDEIIRLFLKKLLVKKFKFEVKEAQNGIEGLELIQDDLPDVVFLDITMPLMDGLEVLEAIRSDPKSKDLCVIIMTAIGDKMVVGKLVQLGITDFLLKPLDYENTTDRLRKIISGNKFLARKAFGVESPEGNEAIEKKNVIIADSDPLFRKFFSDNFSHRFTVTEAATGADCLKMFLEVRPKYVIIGEKLDVINETLLVKKLKELDQDIMAGLYYCADNPTLNSAVKSLFDGAVKKSFVSQTFISEFSKIVLGQADIMENINIILQKQLRDDLFSGIRQTFGLLAREDVDPLAMRDAGKVSTELACKIILIEEIEKIPITAVLFGAKLDVVQIAKRVAGSGASEDKLVPAFKELLENIGGRIKFALGKRGVKTTVKSVDIGANTMQIGSLAWKLVIPFQSQSGSKFLIGILLNV